MVSSGEASPSTASGSPKPATPFTGPITQEDVDRACDELLQAGENPTVERLRQRLGRGSNTTLGPGLRAWREGLGARLLAAQSRSAGAAPPAITQAAEGLWREALALASAQASAGLEEERGELEAQRSALLQERAELERRAQEISEMIPGYEREISAARSEAARALGHAQELATAAQRLEAELASERGALSRMSERLANERARFETERERLQERIDLECQRSFSMAEHHKSELRDLRRELAEELEQSRTLHAQAMAQEIERYRALALDREAKVADLASARAEVARLEALAASAQSELSAARGAAQARESELTMRIQATEGELRATILRVQESGEEQSRMLRELVQTSIRDRPQGAGLKGPAR